MPPLILLVDDNEDALLLGSILLADFGFSCITAHNGQTALALSQQHLPALILLDIVMPEMDGLEVVRQLKADSRTAAIPVIALTCMAVNDDRENILAAGCDDYLRKPFQFEDLKTLVQQYLLKASYQDA
jgi:two-component system, cell cycle response regulator DivK